MSTVPPCLRGANNRATSELEKALSSDDGRPGLCSSAAAVSHFVPPLRLSLHAAVLAFLTRRTLLFPFVRSPIFAKGGGGGRRRGEKQQAHEDAKAIVFRKKERKNHRVRDLAALLLLSFSPVSLSPSFFLSTNQHTGAPAAAASRSGL